MRTLACTLPISFDQQRRYPFMATNGSKICRPLISVMQRHVDLRPGEARRVGTLAAYLFFLLAANNVIKVVRDSLFLSRFPISQLPYVYLMAAMVAAGVIVLYSRYTTTLAFSRLVQSSLAASIASVILFWLLVGYSGMGWVLYAYYLWSAIVGLIVVAQFWTLANEMFTPRDGKRLFGLITAGGTLGGMFAGVTANWAVTFIGTNQLLWLVVAFFAGAYGLARWALREGAVFGAPSISAEVSTRKNAPRELRGIAGTMFGSRYLQMIGAVIFISVVVSTLIDYQFKATAKEAYSSAEALARFFGSYYAWLSLVTLLLQLCLTGKALTKLGLTASLLILPAALFGGSIAVLLWPGVVAATANRMAEASLRTSVNQSGVQILYLPVPDAIKKKVKVFMDVTVERLGDAMAALIILSFSFALGASALAPLSLVSLALILIWGAVVLQAQKGYVHTLRRSLAYREVSLETAPIDYTDRATVDAVLNNLDDKDESSVLFALSLAERMDPRFVVARLPRGLLRHSNMEVRRRALTLLAASLEPNTLAMVFELLAGENSPLRSEAINSIATVLKEAATPLIRPLLNNPEIQTRRAAIQLLLQSGDAEARREALSTFRELVLDRGPGGENRRVEACRLMGEVDGAEFIAYLSQLIREDPAPTVVREAMAAAARRKNPAVIREIVARLGSTVTGSGAHDALVQYGEMAVKELRTELFDNRVSRDIRRQIPKILSKIDSQSAINALQGGLLEEDRLIRYQVILAIDEMARRFPDLRVDREIIESAIMSDALLYFRRLVIFSALFGPPDKTAVPEQSLLYHALTDSMRRVKERVMWLLSLIYPREDIRHARAGLGAADPIARAHGIELLDNLLTGNVKHYVFPLFSDQPVNERLRAALNFIGRESMTRDAAIKALLEQDDRWLKAGTIWEIGQRGLLDFRAEVLKYVGADDALLREAANRVIEGSKSA